MLRMEGWHRMWFICTSLAGKNGTGNLAASEGGFLGVEMILWMSRKLQKEQGA